MQFRLTYTGKLPPNGKPADKHAIRKLLHPQLAKLWMQPHMLVDQKYCLTWPKPVDGTTNITDKIPGFLFCPLVVERLHFVAELDILCLRPKRVGPIIASSGDIDNQLKTLFDALRIPHKKDEIPTGVAADLTEVPFHCLLEDDALISKVSVTTDQALSDMPDDHAMLIINVIVRATKLTSSNIRLAHV
jgi:hypothetical protein